MNIVFLIDTSPSMNQRIPDSPDMTRVTNPTGSIETWNHLTYLEASKAVIEYYFRWPPLFNQKHKYLLASYAQNTLKTPLTSDIGLVLRELAYLTGTDKQDASYALENVFEYLSLYRGYRGLDTFDMGISPADVEQTLILWFTDGLNPCMTFNIQSKHPRYQDFYRWDQKLFTFLFTPDRNPTEIHNLTALLGGQVFYPTNTYHLHQIMDNMFFLKSASTIVEPKTRIVNSRAQSICVEFKDLSSTTETLHFAWLNTVPSITCNFPFPEPFPTDLNNQSTKRRGHPVFAFQKRTDLSPTDIPEGLRYTVLDIDPTSKFAKVLHDQSCKDAKSVWLVWILEENLHSGKRNSHLFGFLRLEQDARKNMIVRFHILPIRYTKLCSIIKKFESTRVCSPELKKEMEEYLKQIPPYYFKSIRNALLNLGMEELLPSQIFEEFDQATSEAFHSHIENATAKYSEINADITTYLGTQTHLVRFWPKNEEESALSSQLKNFMLGNKSNMDEKKNCIPASVMMSSTIGGQNRVKNFFRNAYEEDSVIEIKKHVGFPRRQNVFNEDKRTWPTYHGQQLYSVYRIAGNNAVIERDDESIVFADDNNLLNSIPYNPARLAKGRKVAKKIQQYAEAHNIPNLSSVILFPDKAMTFDFIQTVSENYWTTKRDLAARVSIDYFRPIKSLSTDASAGNKETEQGMDLDEEYSPDSDSSTFSSDVGRVPKSTQRSRMETFSRTRARFVKLLKSKDYDSQLIIKKLEKYFALDSTRRDKLRLLNELRHIASGFRRNDLAKHFLRLEVQASFIVQ